MFDENDYDIGINFDDEELNSANILPHKFHCKCNYIKTKLYLIGNIIYWQTLRKFIHAIGTFSCVGEDKMPLKSLQDLIIEM